MLAGRYRIVGLLGAGGMGEVYRADDLKLGQTVALKFLPERLADDPKRLEYFHNEVRFARQVSHPNVCRVYDIGEVDGQQFLSMEYVDGEDLATLIRRIGRLPPDKGIQIARQLSAGLAAAHDKGVLHRDLKPANVMLDGRGRVRITDFGLARLTDEKGGAGVQAGTPAYMAPEQLAGREVTQRSDIYSLGLLLFEVFTGRPAFQADSLAELAQLREKSSPVMPSSIISDISPVVERAILHCLEREPHNRPASALAVAAALPGGDPLAAALAAGETPSPAMVAAAGDAGRLHPGIGAAYLAVLAVGLCLIAFFSDRLTIVGRLQDRSEHPTVLRSRAREIVAELGYAEAGPGQSAGEFEFDNDYVRYVDEGNPQVDDNLPAMRFWYRQSPEFLVPVRPSMVRPTPTDPPAVAPGMIRLEMDPLGRLLSFEAVPPRTDRVEGEPESPKWSVLFALAGLDETDFETGGDDGTRRAKTTWNPPVYADQRASWMPAAGSSHEGQIAGIEAGGYRGKPVYFQIIRPWTTTVISKPSIRGHFKERSHTILPILFSCIVVSAALLARRNIRMGRTDRRGGFKVACCIFATGLLGQLALRNHIPDLSGEFRMIILGMQGLTFCAFVCWMSYLALEPYVRRFWPEVLISWNRLLDGQFRDPRVGRDVLVGVALGVASFAMSMLTNHVREGHGTAQLLTLVDPRTLLGGRYLAGVAVDAFNQSLMMSITWLLLILLLRCALRKDSLAGAAMVVLLVLVSGFWEDPAMVWVVPVIHGLLFVFVVTRFGLISLIAWVFSSTMLETHPITANLFCWYGSASVSALVVLGGLAIYGYAISFGGRYFLDDGLSKS